MPEIIVQAPTMGLNALLPANMLDARAAHKGSQNMLYQEGRMRKADGLQLLDMTTGLNSGEEVLHIFPYSESDRTSHLMAVTKSKIYENDRINNEWDDRTQVGKDLAGILVKPVSYAGMAHDDTDIYYDDNPARQNAYYHLIVSNGGESDIQRWSGKNEPAFHDVLGGDGYHSGTTHRALHCGVHWNRLILLNPLEYDGSVWIENRQRVRWSANGKLQTWSGTGSGFFDLVENAGTNIWAGPLATQYIIYQDNSIWEINYVGGTDVFRPQIRIPNLGLLSYHLLVIKNNIHYFVGDDYNVHAYKGGSVREKIGDEIQRRLQDELEPGHVYNSWMAIGPEDKWLWIFIVPRDGTYITKAFGRNQTTGAWTVLDFESHWPAGGITAVNLIGAEGYTTGQTYRNALDLTSPFDVSDDGSANVDSTLRYGDVLCTTFSEISMSVDATEASWCLGGREFWSACADVTYSADFSVGDIIFTQDGSDFTQWQFGSHFYSVESVGSNCAVVTARESSLGTADDIANTPASSLAWKVYDPSGDTYRIDVQIIQTQDRLILGSACGLIFRMDETYTDYLGSLIDVRHITPVYDLGLPGRYKRWQGIRITAKGDGVIIRYRTSSFDSSETGWTDFTQSLTSEYEVYEKFINRTAKRIQFSYKDFSGGALDVREFEVLEPEVLDNR